LQLLTKSILFASSMALACAGALCTPALAQAAPDKPVVIAMVATVGDQVSYTRQGTSGQSDLGATYRKTVSIPTQTLNAAVLKGLDRALEREEPGSKRFFLMWNTPADTAEALKAAYGEQRNVLLLEALLAQLRSLPQRMQWDRIEAILPRYARNEVDDMGSKLGGIGFYVQPLKKIGVEFQENGDAITTEADGSSQTVDPKTGKKGKFDTFVAPYFFFDRITLDARTLQVLARKSHFDNTKYHDPNSTAIDVADHMPVAEMFTRLAALMEQSAFRSVRGMRLDVQVSPLQVLPAQDKPGAPSR
jgi:hypothetical protein